MGQDTFFTFLELSITCRCGILDRRKQFKGRARYLPSLTKWACQLPAIVTYSRQKYFSFGGRGGQEAVDCRLHRYHVIGMIRVCPQRGVVGVSLFGLCLLYRAGGHEIVQIFCRLLFKSVVFGLRSVFCSLCSDVCTDLIGFAVQISFLLSLVGSSVTHGVHANPYSVRLDVLVLRKKSQLLLRFL
ncbi:hypothetical protein CEXT_311311 [Caerostris extrusa]|uniref:Uncharacterized protein n=1 Tax=Caerostris extrusa TaxID=172846 RepID=A0AAV4N382_CAEEX|nr:hypothetical protein CEXT_311311 [Caerostris extrusa]